MYSILTLFSHVLHCHVTIYGQISEILQWYVRGSLSLGIPGLVRVGRNIFEKNKKKKLGKNIYTLVLLIPTVLHFPKGLG